VNDPTSATGSPPPVAAEIDSPSLNLGLLGGNTASGTAGGYAVMAIGGTVGASSPLPAQPMPWSVDYSNSDGMFSASTGATYGDLFVPAGVTATIGAGAVFKLQSGVAC